MKHIKVDCCRNCPLRKTWYCLHEQTGGMRIDDLDIIDLNCPLEDVLDILQIEEKY